MSVAEELAQLLMIEIQVERYNPPKDPVRKQDYDRTFARRVVHKLMISGYEFRHRSKDIWTGKPL